MRSSMLDTVREDYLQLARAKGLRDADVRRHHAVPERAVAGRSACRRSTSGSCCRGAIAVESIFSWPGLGQATLRSDPRARLPDAAGAVPVVQRRADRGQPRRRPVLRLPRSAGGGPMTTCRRRGRRRQRRDERRRRRLADQHRVGPPADVRSPTWRAGSGATGLAIAGADRAARVRCMALLAPLLSDRVGTSTPSHSTDNPTWAHPSWRLPARHRQPRAQRRRPVRVGLADQPVRRSGGDAC